MSNKKISFRLLLSGILCAALLGPPSVRAQDCPAWPAKCPERDYPHLDPSDDSLDKLNNPIVPQEAAMEHRLRALTAALMDQLAEKEHWDVGELTESGSSGYRALPPNDTALGYPLRPPHWFTITYQVIVNKDSLAAWSSWLKDFSERRLAAVRGYVNNPDPKQGERSEAAFEAEKRSRGQIFRESTLLVVEFGFNMENAFVSNAQPAGPASGGTTPATLPGFDLVRWYSNPDPFVGDAVNSYANFRNIVLMLGGGWNLKPNAEGFYFPLFRADKPASDRISVKKIKCDKVQTLDIYLSGNKPAIQKFLGDLPASSWGRMIAI